MSWERYQQSKLYPLKRFYAAGCINNAAATTGAPGAIDTLHTAPMLIVRRTLIESLAFNVTSGAASSTGRIGLYNCRDCEAGDLYPYKNLWDSGSISTAGTGVMESYCRRWLDPGLYWLALNFGVDLPTLRSFVANSRANPLGYDSTLTSPGYGWTVASTFGSLPGAFPVGATVLTTTPVLGMFYSIARYG